MPLSFAPGEAYQFDWSAEVVLIGRVTTTVKVAHLRLRHSRMFYVRAYRPDDLARAVPACLSPLRARLADR